MPRCDHLPDVESILKPSRFESGAALHSEVQQSTKIEVAFSASRKAGFAHRSHDFFMRLYAEESQHSERSP